MNQRVSHRIIFNLMGCGLLALLLVACASGNVERRPYLITENLDRAQKHLKSGNSAEAAEIFQAVLLADPENKKANEELKKLNFSGGEFSKPSMLGVNQRPVPPRRSLPLAIGLYPVNRVLDVLDIFSFNFGFQGGLLFDVHATRALQMGAGGGGGVQLGWWQKRNLALGVGHIGELSVAPFSLTNEGFARIGTAGLQNNSYSLIGLNCPTDQAFRRTSDYWGVGCRFILLIIGIEMEFHPVEVADAASGFFLVDFLHDDVGQTLRLKLDSNDRSAIEMLINTLSPRELSANTKKLSTSAKSTEGGKAL